MFNHMNNLKYVKIIQGADLNRLEQGINSFISNEPETFNNVGLGIVVDRIDVKTIGRGKYIAVIEYHEKE